MILFLLIFGVVFIVGAVFMVTFGAARMMSKTPLMQRDPATLSPREARLVSRMIESERVERVGKAGDLLDRAARRAARRGECRRGLSVEALYLGDGLERLDADGADPYGGAHGHRAHGEADTSERLAERAEAVRCVTQPALKLFGVGEYRNRDRLTGNGLPHLVLMVALADERLALG